MSLVKLIVSWVDLSGHLLLLLSIDETSSEHFCVTFRHDSLKSAWTQGSLFLTRRHKPVSTLMVAVHELAFRLLLSRDVRQQTLDMRHIPMGIVTVTPRLHHIVNVHFVLVAAIKVAMPLHVPVLVEQHGCRGHFADLKHLLRVCLEYGTRLMLR